MSPRTQRGIPAPRYREEAGSASKAGRFRLSGARASRPTPLSWSRVAAVCILSAITILAAGPWSAHKLVQRHQALIGQTALASYSQASGYWLVAKDGGIFNFGNAGFYGNPYTDGLTGLTGSHPLSEPIVGMAGTLPAASGPLPPLTISTSTLPSGTYGLAYSATLAASGGSGSNTWSASGLPPGLSISASGVISGTPTATGSSTVSVSVTDSAGDTAAASLSFTVNQQFSQTVFSNWSGYAEQGGPFTGVTGTFTVTDLTSSQPSLCNQGTYGQPSQYCVLSEWAGIDGFDNSSLIQAGIQEEPVVGTDLVNINPWWEILPATETPITSMTVAPGDSVTVTIYETTSPGEWYIGVTDNTNGQSFSTVQPYYGPASSAEWIVEAPTVNGSITTLPEYSPQVSFTGAEMWGSADINNQIYMEQNGSLVSSPSSLTSPGAFTVSYG